MYKILDAKILKGGVMLYFDKGNINSFFENNTYKRISIELTNEIVTEIKKRGSLNREKNILEMSSFYSDSITHFANETKERYFITDSSFEALLAYHITKSQNIVVKSISTNFSRNSIEKLKLTEFFDVIYSILGFSFNNIYELIPPLLSLLKINGFIFLIVPAYWYIKEKITNIEEKILNYSKQNEKKWIFVEGLAPIVKDNKAELHEITELKNNIKLSRYEIAKISSLEKLKEAEEENNIAHLETSNIPKNNFELRTALIVIQKKDKTLTKDNLFKI